MEVHITEARIYKDLNDIIKAKVQPWLSSHSLVILNSLQDGCFFNLCRCSYPSWYWLTLWYYLCMSLVYHSFYYLELSTWFSNCFLFLLWSIWCLWESKRYTINYSFKIYGFNEDSVRKSRLYYEYHISYRFQRCKQFFRIIWLLRIGMKIWRFFMLFLLLSRTAI